MFRHPKAPVGQEGNMEALLALLIWLNLGSWTSPAPGAAPAPSTSTDSAEWASTQDMFPGLPPKP